MNERIALLYEEALVLEGNGDYISGELDVEKFAHLLVKECVNVLNKRFVGDLNREDIEVRRCIVAVKEHFGVE